MSESQDSLRLRRAVNLEAGAVTCYVMLHEPRHPKIVGED